MSHGKHESLSRRSSRDERKRQSSGRIWLWVGVVILCALLLFWIFDIGTFIGPNQ